MSKKTVKIISIVLTIAIALMMTATQVFAATSPSDFDGKNVNDLDVSKLEEAGNSIVYVIRTVGMIVAVVILMVLGIKYMMGSSEEKASYKKTMMPYLVGAILLFGASALAGVIFDFAEDIAK